MDSTEANLSANHSAEALIDWNTPEMLKNIIYERECDYDNNPFDNVALKAENMDPFDLVCFETTRVNPPCDNILSPLFKLEFRQKKKINVSLTDIDAIPNFLEETYPEQVKGDILKNNDDITVCVNEKVVDQSKENILIQIDENKIENQDPNIELVSTSKHNNIELNVDVEQIPLCTEEEKKQIREETRQRIEVLIEKGKKIYEAKSLHTSLSTIPSFSEACINNKHKHLFNRGFIRTDSSSKIFDNMIDSSENDLSSGDVTFSSPELKISNLLESLEPEWVVDSFIDSEELAEVQADKSVSTLVDSFIHREELAEVQTDKSVSTLEPTNNNSQVDVTLKTINHMEIDKSIPIKHHTYTMKSMQNKRILRKGPFIANIPLHHMVQNYKNADIKETTETHISPRNYMMPLAQSTPTSDTTTPFKTPLSESSVRSKSFVSTFMHNSAERPNSKLNFTKCFKRSVSNVESALSNLDMNTSKWESKIRAIQKPMPLTTNKRSGLPVLKQFTKSEFKGKENVIP